MMIKLLLLLVLLHISVFAGEYENWSKAQEAEYKQYQKTIDKEFSKMLKKHWSAYKTFREISSYEKPKPLKILKVEKKKKIPLQEIQKSKPIKLKKIKKLKQKKIVIVAPVFVEKLPKKKVFKTEPKDIDKKIIVKKEFIVLKKNKKYRSINFDFYSIPIEVAIDKKQHFKLKTISKDTIAKFWDKISQSDYESLLKMVKLYEDTHHLNDWALYQLLEKIGFEYYKDQNLAHLFTWFVLAKKNYDVKIGYNDKKVFLLANVDHNLYQMSFFSIKKKRYYTLDISGKSKKIEKIYTYNGDYSKTKKLLNFNIKEAIVFNNKKQKRVLTFKYDDQEYSVDSFYNKDLVDFYSTYPQSEYPIYFKENIKENTMYSMLNKLKNIIKGKTELEAVNIILRFTQTSFKYKTDQEQFKYEKVLFPEETLYYPYSDCEDRSIMFSYLVTKLLGLKVVAVKYSDHLASAVEFSTKIKGDGFKYKNHYYTISDPTYINANVGKAMPKYKQSDFKVIQY